MDHDQASADLIFIAWIGSCSIVCSMRKSLHIATLRLPSTGQLYIYNILVFHSFQQCTLMSALPKGNFPFQIRTPFLLSTTASLSLSTASLILLMSSIEPLAISSLVLWSLIRRRSGAGGKLRYTWIAWLMSLSMTARSSAVSPRSLHRIPTVARTIAVSSGRLDDPNPTP